MNLVFDLGNTQLKIGVFSSSSLISTHVIHYHELEKLEKLISSIEIDKIALSSVRNIPEKLKELLKQYESVYYFDIHSDIPINIEYSTPETLGHDRVCNVIGAHVLYPNKNVLVIDLGTCNKYDFISSKANYIGGAISPGFKMRFDSMNHFTDQLPLIDPIISEKFIGDSTINSMTSGAFYGIIGEINFYVEQYERQFHDINVVIIGGFARYFEKALKNHIFAHPYLTLIGLNTLLNFQKEK